MMSRLERISSLAVTIALTNCGGRTVGSGEEPPAEERMNDSDPEPASPAPRPSDEAPPGNMLLGQCVPGFDPDRYPERSCDWLAEQRCYPTKQAACNCACPRNVQNSTCVSGFDYGPDLRIDVHCF